MTNAGIFIANVPLFSLSNKAISLVCVCGISASMVLLSLATKFAWYVLVYGVVFGLFIGYGYMAPIKNCYSHLPDRKGLCSGVCLTGFGLGALFFNLILTGLINPNNEKQTDHLFPVYVGNRLPFALQMISIVYLAVGMLGVLLMTPPSDTADTKGRYSRMEALRLAIYD